MNSRLYHFSSTHGKEKQHRDFAGTKTDLKDMWVRSFGLLLAVPRTWINRLVPNRKRNMSGGCILSPCLFRLMQSTS